MESQWLLLPFSALLNNLKAIKKNLKDSKNRGDVKIYKYVIKLLWEKMLLGLIKFIVLAYVEHNYKLGLHFLISY